MKKMEISNITIKRISENKWHVWFASCVLWWVLKLSNIAIFKRYQKDWYRLVFPEKRIEDKKIQLFFPLTKEFYLELENAVSDKI